MKFGISVPPFGDYGDARYLANIAREAAAAGWDGFFIWDHIIFDPSFHPIADPWVALAAIAMHTQRIRIGTVVTPVARRRPWKLARETVSVDRLSNGRLILGVGLGDPVQWDYGFLGEAQDAKVRAKKLDEGLDILSGLWSGERFSYTGEHYQLAEMTFRPRPTQTPRIPVWVGGGWDKHAPMRRAARWDGYFPLKWGGSLTPDEWRDIMRYIHEHCVGDTAFDFVHSGATPGDDPAKAAEIINPYLDVGITWWMESVDPWRFGLHWEAQLPPESMRQMDERIRQGPPRL
jgi:alkanesulfonate monooxygenase SsuD/methylene tetrahydromethanopterin reductase-like flavin-dependent oxidoreductase (luciferase family)